MTILLPCCLHRQKVYMQVKKYAQKYAREVKTRHRTGSDTPETDRLRSMPTCKPKMCNFLPEDSKHGGWLFCGGPIMGKPDLVDFMLDDEGNNHDPSESPWVTTLLEVWKNLKEHYDKGYVFYPEREESWENFFNKQVPWNGLESLQHDRLPVFELVPPDVAEETTEDGEITKMLQSVGQDEQGRRRFLYKDGKDVAVYEPAKLWANFSGRMLDGTTLDEAEKKKGGFGGAVNGYISLTSIR